MHYLQIRTQKRQPTRKDGRLIHHSNDLLRTASENAINEERMKAYRDLHEIDVTDEQEALPPEYQEMLDNDKGFQEFLDNVDKAPF